MAKKEKKAVPESKTPELTNAKKALDNYLKEHDLDPTKDWTKDKKHGKKLTELINKLNKERDKVAAKFPETDLKNEKKLAIMKKKGTEFWIQKKEAKKKAKEEAKKEKVEKGNKEPKEKKGRSVTKYDYPLIDGREMSSDEKKKYRMEQRKLAKGTEPKEKKEPKAKKEKKLEKPSRKKKAKVEKDKKANAFIAKKMEKKAKAKDKKEED